MSSTFVVKIRLLNAFAGEILATHAATILFSTVATDHPFCIHWLNIFAEDILVYEPEVGRRRGVVDVVEDRDFRAYQYAEALKKLRTQSAHIKVNTWSGASQMYFRLYESVVHPLILTRRRRERSVIIDVALNY